MENQDDITLITIFYDIGRGTWDNEYRRSERFYIDSFLKYFDYPYKMVCFIDDRYIDEIICRYAESKYRNKIFIPINRDWLTLNTRAWQNSEKDRTIINSSIYQDFIKEHRMNIFLKSMPIEKFNPNINIKGYLYPENVYSEYNTINHSKVDLMVYAKKCGFVKTNFIGWTDFGIFSSLYKTPELYPTRTIDVKKLAKNKFTFMCSRGFYESDFNMYFTLINSYQCFFGGFFATPIDMLDTLQRVYHESVDELYANYISDDDQHVLLRAYLKYQELFHVAISIYE
jgi:Holliday junction resolvase RusA-like endonuclease